MTMTAMPTTTTTTTSAAMAANVMCACVMSSVCKPPLVERSVAGFHAISLFVFRLKQLAYAHVNPHTHTRAVCTDKWTICMYGDHNGHGTHTDIHEQCANLIWIAVCNSNNAANSTDWFGNLSENSKNTQSFFVENFDQSTCLARNVSQKYVWMAEFISQTFCGIPSTFSNRKRIRLVHF